MTEHLTNEQLLQYMDGELPKTAMHTAEGHIQSCWSCRTGLERLQQDIGMILDAQNGVLLPSLPPPPNNWPGLDPRLQTAIPRTGWREALLGRTRMRAYATVCAAAAVVMVCLVWLTPPAISARAVLERVMQADQSKTTALPGRVVRQKVRVNKISRTSQNVVSSELIAWGSPSHIHWSFGHSEAGTDLQRRYRERQLTNLPLSPPVYRSFAEGAEKDSVTRSASQLNVFFETSSHPLPAVQLFVTPGTWHVTRMDLDFGDARFEIVEEELTEVGRNDVPTDILARLEPSTPIPDRLDRTPRVSSLEASPEKASETAVDLDELEMDVRFALHQIGADLGEPIEVNPVGPGRLQVRAWNVPEQRRELLRRLLANFSAVDLLFEPLPASGPVVDLTADASGRQERSSDEERLKDWFGGGQAVEGFTRVVLSTSGDLLSRLYAMKHLADRWPPGSRLAESARSKLIAMIEDHERQAEQLCSELQLTMKPLLDAFSKGAPASAVSTAGDWRLAAAMGLDAAKQMDAFLRSLLTASSTPATLAQALPVIQGRLAQLTANLATIRRPKF